MSPDPTHASLPWRRPAALVAAMGGALVVAGTFLPWLTLFAGLRSLNGLAGRNGRLLLAAGVAELLLCAVAAWRPHAALRHAALALGAAQVGFVAYLALGLRHVLHGAAGDPMLVARVGPGLVVAAAGALLATLAAAAAGGTRPAALSAARAP